MASLNRVILIGRLVRDPEMRYTSSGLAVTSFTIAVDRRQKSADGQKQADFFRCNAWRQLAEIVNEYARKGRLVALDGSIKINEYTAQDGTRKQSVDVDVDNFQMLDRGDDTPGGGQSGSSDNGYYPDEEPAERPARAAVPRAQSAPREDAPERPARASAPRPAAPAAAPAKRGAAKPAEAMYPEDDFDDSDPFADE